MLDALAFYLDDGIFHSGPPLDRKPMIHTKKTSVLKERWVDPYSQASEATGEDDYGPVSSFPSLEYQRSGLTGRKTNAWMSSGKSALEIESDHDLRSLRKLRERNFCLR